ncbi:MAG: serine proteinase, partial [Sphingomonas bacterium]|nr:serine proteinase [Sphingomonas bacterium]
MTRTPYSSDLLASTMPSSARATRRRNLCSQASRLTLRSAIAVATVAGVSFIAPGQAWAQCLVGVTTVTCDNTVTTDTTFPANPPVDRNYQGLLPGPIV